MTLHQKHGLRLFLIIIATIFYFLANFQRVAIPGAVFNLLQTDFATSASKITLLGAIFCYTYALTQLIIGLLVDKIGGFRVIALGAVLFSVGCLIFPHAETLGGLYLSRGLIGFGAATFYLSTIREVKKYSKDKNFSLAISYILFIGYSGGVFANAPYVALIDVVGWKNSLYIIAYFTLTLAILYLILLFIFKPVHIEKDTHITLAPFREILTNKKNINLYIFGATNYGLYYVLQSVIGKKFLEDFCYMTNSKAAFILSMMAVISAFAGTITAFISRSINNRRSIIFKTYSILSMLSVLSVFLLLVFNIHSEIVALIFCIPSFIGSISPILILALHSMNRYEVSATAVSIQNCAFFMTVGLLGMVSGMLMNVFEPLKTQNALIYSNKSYLLVFSLFLILSLVEVFCAFKIKDEKIS